MFKSNRRPVLGIDIGSSHVNLLELTANPDGYCINNSARIRLPTHAIEGGIVKSIDAISDCVSSSLATTPFSSKYAVLAVPDSCVMSKTIQVDKVLSEIEMEEFVMMESAIHLPYPMDEINLDFNVLGISSENESMLDVLVVASRSNFVNPRVQAITQAGLEVRIVEVESHAIERIVRLVSEEVIYLDSVEQPKIFSVIDIGEAGLRYFVFRGSNMIFFREEGFDGENILETLVQSFGMTVESAETLIEQGMLRKDVNSNLFEYFRKLIVLQVKRGFQCFFSSMGYTRIDCIWLVGEGAQQLNIRGVLENEMNCSTSMVNAFSDIPRVEMKNHEQTTYEAPSLLVAFGLALRGVGYA